MQHAKSLAVCVVLVVAAYLVGRSTLEAQQPVPTLDRQFTPGTVFADARTPISSLPFTINSCGSYFLTACLTGQENSDGIVIDASDVTIDLNGFSLVGVPNSRSGIIVVDRAPDRHRNIEVKNGTIARWGTTGISGGGAINARYERLRISANAGTGLFANHCVVSSCAAEQNGGTGLDANNSTIAGCTSSNNVVDGIRGSNSLITGNSAIGNGNLDISAMGAAVAIHNLPPP